MSTFYFIIYKLQSKFLSTITLRIYKLVSVTSEWLHWLSRTKLCRSCDLTGSWSPGVMWHRPTLTICWSVGSDQSCFWWMMLHGKIWEEMCVSASLQWVPWLSRTEFKLWLVLSLVVQAFNFHGNIMGSQLYFTNKQRLACVDSDLT